MSVAALILVLLVSGGPVELPLLSTKPVRALAVEAIINGTHTLLIVDTGATSTIVDARLLGYGNSIRAARQHQNIVLLGERRVVLVELQLARLLWVKRKVVVMNLDKVRELYGRKIGGILGLDLLEDLGVVVFDFKRKLLILSSGRMGQEEK